MITYWSQRWVNSIQSQPPHAEQRPQESPPSAAETPSVAWISSSEPTDREEQKAEKQETDLLLPCIEDYYGVNAPTRNQELFHSEPPPPPPDDMADWVIDDFDQLDTSVEMGEGSQWFNRSSSPAPEAKWEGEAKGEAHPFTVIEDHASLRQEDVPLSILSVQIPDSVTTISLHQFRVLLFDGTDYANQADGSVTVAQPPSQTLNLLDAVRDDFYDHKTSDPSADVDATATRDRKSVV